MKTFKENPAKKIQDYGSIQMSLIEIIEFFNWKNSKGEIVSIEIMDPTTFDANTFFSQYTEVRKNT